MADAITMMELAHDKGFQLRVKFFMNKSAIAIMNGEVTGPRTVYSQAVLGDPSLINPVTGKIPASTLEMAIAVASDTAVETAGQAATDAEIESAITARWNAMAGITL